MTAPSARVTSIGLENGRQPWPTPTPIGPRRGDPDAHDAVRERAALAERGRRGEGEIVAGGAAHERHDGARDLVRAARDLALIGRQAVAEQHERRVVALLARAVSCRLRRVARDRGELGVVALDVADPERQLTGHEMRGDAAGGNLRVLRERADGGAADDRRRCRRLDRRGVQRVEVVGGAGEDDDEVARRGDAPAERRADRLATGLGGVGGGAVAMAAQGRARSGGRVRNRHAHRIDASRARVPAGRPLSGRSASTPGP